MKKNILIISIYYPPIQSIASNRIESFSKYLDRKKYNVFVHTLASNEPCQIENTVVHRVKNRLFFKPLLFTKRTNKIIHYSKIIYNKLINKLFSNEYKGWIKNSLNTLPTFIKKNKIDIILSTYSPSSPHIVALELKKQFPYLIWIADMRDEMSMSIGLSLAQKKVYQLIEKDIYSYSSAIITVSKPILDEFKSMCTNNNMKFCEIRNGYDFELINSNQKNKIFTITYTGNFYGERNPTNFLNALSNIVTKYKLVTVRVKFIGVKTHFEIPNNLKKIVEIIPSMSHDEAIKIMINSNLLLMIHPTNGRKGVFTGKIFEYLGTLTPILALVDEQDVAAKLIEDTNAGFVSDNDNILKIQSKLLLSYDEWNNNIDRIFNKELIKKHHRKNQVIRLEKLIEKLVSEK